jgi:hypothetical protein
MQPQVINEYESGKAIPNNQVIAKIERALGAVRASACPSRRAAAPAAVCVSRSAYAPCNAQKLPRAKK